MLHILMTLHYLRGRPLACSASDDDDEAVRRTMRGKKPEKLIKTHNICEIFLILWIKQETGMLTDDKL